jgi:hypothetical protein
MDLYLQKVKDVVNDKFNGDVIPIALVKNEKKPLYPHANKTNEELWKKWDKKGVAEVLSENADMGLLIRNHSLVVIDFDNKEQSSMFEDNIPEFQHTVKQSTKKGFHYFFKGTQQTKDMKLSNQVRPFGENIDIDIITTWDKGTGGIITVFPSANKEWINNITEIPILPLPEKFIEFYNDKSIKKIKNEKKAKKQETKNEDNECCDFDTLKKIVMGLNAERSISFDSWHTVVWAIYNVGKDANVSDSKIVRLIHNFSEMSGDKYDEDKVDDFISNNTIHCENGYGYKLGTLIAFLKEDNIELYNILFTKTLTYAKQKELFELTHFKIIHPPCYCTIQDDGDIKIQSRKAFKESYEHILAFIPKLNQSDTFLDMWFKDPKIRLYEHIDFIPPPLPCPQNTFNMWRGFAAENLNVESSNNIEPVMHHINVLVNHDEKARDYLIKWLAHIIQYPGLLNGIALVFKSEQGSGKNVLLEFMSEIIGNDLYFETADPTKQLWSRFANGRKNRLLINIDETSGKDTIPASQQLKNHITSKHFNYEAKGVDPITLVNINRFVFTTNNQTPIKIESGDRRYVVFQCSDEKKGNTKYFNELVKFFNEPSNQKAFYEYLKGININNVDWINDRPITELYKDIQEANHPIQIKFFKWLVETHDNDFSLRYSSESFFDHFNEFVKKGQYKNVEMNETSFRRLMKPYIKTKGSDDVPSKAFINKSMSNGRVVYKVTIKVIRSWLIENKYVNDCFIVDEE